jgi:hypothetical protein
MWTCSAADAADCRPPIYRRGFVWEDSPVTIMMNISLPINEFAPARLVCLAQQLRHNYSSRQKVLIFMFSSYVAAERYTRPMTGDNVNLRHNWAAHNHATYSFDAGEHQEYLDLQPLGAGPSTISASDVHTTINLPVNSIPSCTAEIAGRCLLALSSVDYPWRALASKISGTITLEATIAPDGTVKNIKAITLEADKSDSEQLLSDAAIQNLKTWHFEVAGHEHPIRIVYSYTIESAGRPGHRSVRFELPHKVEIVGTPLK